MNAFEQIVGMLLERNGHWVRSCYKVRLTKMDKVRIGRPSCPRWELDVVAYKAAENLVRVVECKSLLNSPGVPYESFSGRSTKGAGRYKLFTDGTARRIVLSCLRKQLEEQGLVRPEPEVRLCLAAGHIRRGDEVQIRQHCQRNGWDLFDAPWFREQFDGLADADYENDIAIVAAKLANISVHV